MNAVDLKFLIVLLALVAVVTCADNATTAAAASASAGSTTPATPTTTRKPSSVLEDIGKTIAAIPIGIAEFCKDSAAAVEDLFTSIFG